mgnify:FL=1
MRSIVKGVPTFMYGEELSRQLALDYCCSPADVADSENHFSIYAPQEGRRRFQEALIRGLKIAVVNGKLLFTGSEEIVAECRKRYANVTGEWFFDAKRLREIEELLLSFVLRRRILFFCRKPMSCLPLAFLCQMRLMLSPSI